SLLVSYVDAVDATDKSWANAVISTGSSTSVGIYKSLLSPASGRVLVGGTVVYNIQVANTGTGSLATVAVSDAFDSTKLQYVSATTAPSSTGTGTLSWNNVGPLSSGQLLNIQVSFTALAAATTSNSASVSGTATAGPSSASVIIDNPHVSLVKSRLTPLTGSVYKGNNVVFRIVVTNDGSTNITSLPMGDSFSGRSYQFVSATTTPDASGSGSLLWNNLGPLAAGASKTIDVTMLLTGAAAPADNTADISYAVDANGNALAPVTSTASITTLAGTIGSTIYQDKNNNGAPDSGEGIANVTVFADLNSNGSRDAGEPFAVTDSSGTYQLYNLAMGTYSVVVDTSTLPANLTKETVDPDATKDNKTSVTLTTLAPDNTTCNFGYQYPAVSGTVYDDANGLTDGTINGSGSNAGGLLYANLISSANLVVQAVAVASGGTYTFPNVTPNNYTILLGSTQGTVGASAPAATLPGTWVNTGEFLGSGSGSDGTVNGILAVSVGASDVANANFGIDQRPSAVAATGATTTNPGGTTTVQVPTLSGTDPEGSPVTKMIIKTLPTNGTLYYNGVAVTVGQTLTSYNSTLLMLDPTETGAATVTFTYSVVDAAGAESSVAASATMTFTAPPLKISIGGTVFDDANGLIGTPSNTIDGTATNAGNSLYANLINASGNVAEVVAVAGNGTYSFGSVATTDRTAYTIRLSTTAGTLGSAAPAAVLPTGWANTGEFLGGGAGNDGTPNGILGPFSVAGSDVTNANFGINQLPDTGTVTAPGQANPNGVTSTVSASLFSGTDTDGTVTGLRITTFPTNVTRITLNGTNYTTQASLGSGVTVATNSSGQPTSTISVIPVTGSVSVVISYAAIDSANQVDPTPGSVTLPFTGYSISGNVYDDANGLNDSAVNGTGTNAGGTLYANLINSSNLVSQAVAVAANGSYVFNAVTAATYSVVLSTTSGTAGQAAPATALPSGWVNTGEGMTTAGTLPVDGIILGVAVTSSSVANVNFGIDRTPTANTVTAAAQLNPGSTAKVVVPTLSGSDAEDTTPTTVVIKSLPTNATLYYNGSAVTVNQVITSYSASLMALDPNDGALTASFTYAMRDLAGKESAVAATVSMQFTDISITGNVYNDANGLTDSTVNGSGTNAGATVYANLVNDSNLVLQSVLVAADGSYGFSGVAPNASYGVLLSANQGLVGRVAPTAVLPAGYVYTGEHLGSGSGSDGTPDGLLTVAVTTSSVSNANFGIERSPTAAAVTAASQVNPAGTTRVQVAALSATDPEDTSLTTFIIKTLPSNGTLYYNGTAVTAGQTISSYSASLLTLDPNDGSITVSFTYSAVDAAGKESSVTSVSLPFVAVGITGTVFDDANGSMVQNGLEAGTYASGSLSVNLLDTTGTTVVATTTVGANGSYTFATVAANTTYIVQLSTVGGTPGDAAPAATLPSGWVTTGENSNATPDANPNGRIVVELVTSTVSGQNFGIEQLPGTSDVSAAAQANPGGSAQVQVPTLSGSDPEDSSITSFKITTLPLYGTLYYNSIAVTQNQIISSYDPTKLTVDPSDGVVTVDFDYAAVDAAGKPDPTSAVVSMSFTTLSISGTVWHDVNGSANGAFTNIYTSSESGTSAGGIHANLIGSDNKVIESVVVNADGTYAFTGLNGNQSGLSINLTATSATVGVSAPAASLPSTWVATSPLTQTAFGLGTTSLTAKDFGIEQPPSAQGGTQESQPNPGSTTSAAVDSTKFVGSDPDGVVKTYVITAMPANATSITINGTNYTTITGSGVSITAESDGTLLAGKISVDPVDGAVNVPILFKVSDAAGKFSSVATVNVPFGLLTLSGTVWGDVNNSAIGTFSSIHDTGETGSNAGGLYAILVGANGNEIARTTVGGDGSYLFSSVTPNQTGVSVWLSSNSTEVASSLPAPVLPSGWVNTSPLKQTAFNVVTTSIAGKDFGIEQYPDSESSTDAAQINPGGSTSVVLSSSLFHGTDPDGTVANIRITAFPTNATSITIDGTQYTAGTFPALGVTVTTNTSGNPTKVISVDPASGAVSVMLTYAAIDNAGKEDPSPGTVTVPFTYITLSGTVFDDANGLTDSTVNGTGSNASGTLHVNLIDPNGLVLATTSVNSNGTYSFTNVPPNTRSEVMLSTIAGVVGESEPGYALPTNWVNTGESAGGTLDGHPDGELLFSVGTSDVAALNFGIEQLPNTVSPAPTTYANPGGTTKVQVPTWVGTDPEDTTVTSFKIVSIPDAGTLYYNNVLVTLNQVITSYDPALLKVDPNDGAETVIFSYAAVDAAGQVDPTPSLVYMTFTNITLAGTVFDDADGSKVQNGAEAGTYVGGALFVNLLNAAGTSVVASTAVASNGSYSFADVTPNTSYTLQLTLNPGTSGQAAPDTALPSGWVNTGENAGDSADATVDGKLSVGVVAGAVAAQNFGIEQLPESGVASAGSQINPGSTTGVAVSASLFSATDVDGTVTNLRIPTFPSNATSIMIGGSQYTASGFPSGGVTVSCNSSGQPSQAISVDPVDGAVSVVISYVAIDNAGKEDSTPGRVTLPFTLSMSGTVFDDANGSQAQNSGEAGTNAGSGLHVNLLDATGATVLATTSVASDGSYAFTSVTANTTYVLQLSSNQGVPNSAAPATSLPSGWTTTGENAAGTPDGNPNGKLQVVVVATNASNQNFGIEQVPSTTDPTPSEQANPGGTATVQVPTLSGSDPEDTTVTSFKITSLPVFGTLYYNNTAVTLNQVISGYDPTKLKVDPLDGAVTVDFDYAAVDAAGKADPAMATVTMVFGTLSISGSVWDDADGSAINTFTGIYSNGENGTDAGGIHANLIDDSNHVIATVPVGLDGSYAFTGLNGNQSGLSINLTPAAATLGSTSTASLPSGWVATSPLTQTTFNLVTTSITAKDFGIEQPPTAQGVDVPGQANPGGSTAVTVPSANFLASDPEGLVQSYVITAMPTHANHVVINGSTYATSASGNTLAFPAGGVTITADADGLLPAGMVAVDPADGTVTVEILFKVSDAAGKFSSVEFLYIPFGMVTIGGTVWEDPNNIAAGSFTNLQGASDLGANATGTYAILVSSAGNVVASQALAVDGTYLFLNVVTPQTGLTVRLAASPGTLGQPAPTAALPTGWTATSLLTQASFDMTGTSIGALDFGIEQLPESESATASIQANPGGSTSAVVSSSLFHGTDPDGTVNNIRIIGMPTNATSITINGSTYTSGTFPSGGVTVPTNTSGYPTETISVDPTDGAVNVLITYAAIDNGGKEDPTPGAVTVPFSYISLSGTVFNDANGLTDSTVNGTGSNAGGTLYVNLIDQNNNVLASTSVNSDGTYAFTNVTPNTLTEVMLTTQRGVAGQPEPGYVLPANWVNTGESVNGTPDGHPDGELKFSVTTSSVSTLNFGIEQLPNTTDLRPSAQSNPRGTVQVTVPTLIGSDPEDDLASGVHSFEITSLPTNGTLYYNNAAVTLNQVISSYDSAKLKVDPNDGAVTVSFSYAAVDTAGYADPVPATVAMPFTDIALSGTVFDDADGSKILSGSEAGTDAGGSLYVNLLNAAGTTVVATGTVNSDGTYSITSVAPNTSYILQLTINQGTAGQSAPASALPTNWVNTGENAGGTADGTMDGKLSVAVVTSSVAAQSFGIEQLPNSYPASRSYMNPGSTATVTVPTLSGSDPEDGDLGYGNTVVTALPSNASLYYDSVAVSTGQTITNYNPAKLTIDPHFEGSGVVTFAYAFKDAAGQLDPTAATVTLTFTGGSLSGTVFDDATGLNDSTVNGTGSNVSGTLFANLLDASHTVLASVAVASDGTYTFNGISGGSDTVQLSIHEGTVGQSKPLTALPSGWIYTGENLGASSGSDGTPNGLLAVSVAGDVTQANFGIVQAATISGSVRVDTDGDEIGNVGLGGVTLTLKTGGGSTLATTTTASDGSYSFLVVPGSYQVVQTQPAGYDFLSDADGGDAFTIGDLVSITVAEGATSSGNDFIDTSCPDTWAQWKAQHPYQSATDNLAGGAYDNLAEFAFALPTYTGAGNAWWI
ncbi:MAG: SdrD B-like domain-containing protein, partial [Verrucomicrobiota bacterium]